MRSVRPCLYLAVTVAVTVLLGVLEVVPAGAASPDPKLMARLNDEQRQVYGQWLKIRGQFDRQLEAYWSEISRRRSERRRKIGADEPVTAADFVMQQPPKYTGSALRADIAKIQASLAPAKPDTELPTLADMLTAARQHYRFAPSLTSEREFKRRYAAEALEVGLTKEQVVRVYALETGGRGTFDMQAGINPETKAGRAISTAMGYAQLLAANSIDEMVRYGDGFIQRLSAIAAQPGTPPERISEIKAKIESLRLMLRTGRSVPREWSAHVSLSTTATGYGIHALNLDADIGPWLQVIKLKGIKDLGEKHGRAVLSPAELELMNLAGPRTGLEMLDPHGNAAPTANFFSQAGYYRNTIVREKTGGELLAAIDQRMTENMARAGSIEFATVFDEVMAGSRNGQHARQPIAFDERRQLLPARAAPALVPAAGMVRDNVQPLVPPAPVPARAATRPQYEQPTPRMQWGAPLLRSEATGRPVGFPD